MMAEAVGEEHGRLQMRRLWEENERLRASQRAAARANSQLRLELGLLQAAGEAEGFRVKGGDEEEMDEKEEEQGDRPMELQQGQEKGNREEAEGEGLEMLLAVSPRRPEEGQEGLEKLVAQHQVGTSAGQKEDIRLFVRANALCIIGRTRRRRSSSLSRPGLTLT